MPHWPLARQTPGQSGRFGDCQFHINCDVESCDYFVVLEDLITRQTTRCPPDNTLLVTFELLPSGAGTVLRLTETGFREIGWNDAVLEEGGGRVLAMTTLTETRSAREIAIRPEMFNVLWEKHGRELEEFWQGTFGHGTACLTNVEAGYLCRVESVAAVKSRMAKAAELARSGGLSSVDLF